MLRSLRHLLSAYQLPGAAIIFMLEGLGAPLPVEVPLGIIGYQMASGQSTFWQMTLLMWLSTVVGNTAGYMLGYYGGRPAALKMASWFRVKPETWAKLEHWFQKHGLKVVLATRWFNWGFAQNMWLCGITRVPFRRFFLVMVINDLVWSVAWTWVSREAMVYFRRNGMRFLHVSSIQMGIAALLVLGLGLGIWFLVRWWKRRKQKQEMQ